MKAKYCIYTRVSTKKQGESKLSLESQTYTCKSYIESVGGECLMEFRDIESGASTTRRGLNSALEYCKKKNAILVIAKLDRLARDVEFTFKVMNMGVEIYFCDMPHVNTMILGVFASISQYEREAIVDRILKALAAKKARGEKWNQNSVIPEGAREKSAIVRKEAAKANINNVLFYEFINDYQAINGKLTANSDFNVVADELNRRNKKTATGLEFNSKRARAMFEKVKVLYN